MEEKKTKILIVDDDKFLLEMYSIKFSEYNFEVTSSLGSIDALEKIEGGYEPDIVLLDIVMPTMDGFELLERIKNSGLIKGAKIVILSNLGQPGDIERGKELGARGYIVKASATPTEVVKKVMEIVGIETQVSSN